MACGVSSRVIGQREWAIGGSGWAADTLMPVAPVSPSPFEVSCAQAPRALFTLMPRLFISRMRRRHLHLVARVRLFVPAGKRRFVPV